jgi:hypothetical protein
MKYPLSVNELNLLFRTVEWLITHLGDIVKLLQERQGDEELVKVAKSAHQQLETLLDHLEQHYASIGGSLKSRESKKLPGNQ